ncbi:unnamed protein product, partial [Ectocarpus sp. 13 AM-2016]
MISGLWKSELGMVIGIIAYLSWKARALAEPKPPADSLIQALDFRV